MAVETITIIDGLGATKTVLADLIGSDYAQVLKAAFGEDSTLTLASATNPFPVTLDPNGKIPAAVRTQDDIAVALQTGIVMNGQAELTPIFEDITVSAATSATVVPLVSSKKIRLLAAAFVVGSAVSVNFQSHTTTATKTGAFPVAANGGVVLPFTPTGWFETVAGEALDIAFSGSATGGGQVVAVAV